MTISGEQGVSGGTFKKEFVEYQEKRRAFWNSAVVSDAKPLGRYYHGLLEKIYSHQVPAGSSVLELGCADGDLLAAMKPSSGVGVDFSASRIDRARKRHPNLEFVLADAHELALGDRVFDYVLVSELVNDLWDVQTMLENVLPYCGAKTRVIFNFYSHLWNVPLRLARRLGLARPNLPQNWLTPTIWRTFWKSPALRRCGDGKKSCFRCRFPCCRILPTAIWQRSFRFAGSP